MPAHRPPAELVLRIAKRDKLSLLYTAETGVDDMEMPIADWWPDADSIKDLYCEEKWKTDFAIEEGGAGGEEGSMGTAIRLPPRPRPPRAARGLRLPRPRPSRSVDRAGVSHSLNTLFLAFSC
jgi:hypothetical protein